MLPVVILLIVIATFGIIALVAYIIHRVLHPKLKDEQKKPDESEMVKENLQRILEDVDDEETAKKIAEYKEEDDR